MKINLTSGVSLFWDEDKELIGLGEVDSSCFVGTSGTPIIDMGAFSNKPNSIHPFSTYFHDHPCLKLQ